MRKRKFEKRELVNAVLYLVKTLCQWRNLPHDYALQFLYEVCEKWIMEQNCHHLTASELSKVFIDSQNFKTTSATVSRGFDEGKNKRTQATYRRSCCQGSFCFNFNF